MDLHLHSYPHLRLPDWSAAATAGFAAGAVVMVLEFFWSLLVYSASPWAISHLIAAIVMGPAVLQSNEFSAAVVTVALLAHYALGIVFGLVLAFAIASLSLDSSVGMVSVAGMVFGASLYLLNFHGMTRFFPWFINLRGTETLWIHLIFGVTAALLYWKLNRRL